MSDTENTQPQTKMPAAGSGAIVNDAPQATLQAKLDRSQTFINGTEDLSPELAERVSGMIRDGETSPATKAVLTAVLRYMRDTGPNTNLASPEDGARMFLALYRDVQHYIDFAPADFRKGLGAVLRIVNDQKKAGVFGPRYMFRFVPHLKVSTKDHAGISLLFETLSALANPDGRATMVRQVNFPKLGGTALSEQGVQNLVGFFNI